MHAAGLAMDFCGSERLLVKSREGREVWKFTAPRPANGFWCAFHVVENAAAVLCPMPALAFTGLSGRQWQLDDDAAAVFASVHSHCVHIITIGDVTFGQ